MPRYCCIVEYDGTGYAGWQRQHDQPTIQQAIEEAIESFYQAKVEVVASGRTDAGVHAHGQVIHFDLERDIPPFKVASATNHFLKGKGVAFLDVSIVPETFHARFSAKERHYVYRIINRRAPLVLEQNRAWGVHVPLDVEAMQKAANLLLGRHDFTSFRDSECQAKSAVKTINAISVQRQGDVIEIRVSARSFLHHMVRNIVGTLKYVGEGKFSTSDVQSILEACDRKKAGPTAPPGGLFFLKVDY